MIALSVIFFVTLVVPQLAKGKGNQCIDRPFTHYLEINEGNLYPNPRDFQYMQSFTSYGMPLIEP